MQPCKLVTPFATLEGLPASVVDVLVDTFDADVARLVSDMSQACHDRDYQRFRFAALGLAGVAGTYGVTELEALVRQSLHLAPAERVDLLAAIEAAATVARWKIRQASCSLD